MASRIPGGAVVQAASTSATTGTASASIGSTSGNRVTYLTGFAYQGSNATAGQTGTITITGGPAASTMNFAYPTLAAAATVPQPPPLVVTFDPPLPSAENTQIVVTGPALGTGAPISTINIWGYML